MWEWILKTLDRLCRSDNISSVKGIAEADDIKQEVCLYLVSNPEIAEEVYCRKKIPYLNKLVKRTVYSIRAKTECEQKKELSSYQRIQSICEMYHIPMTVENAYKISHIMENENYNADEFAIHNIIRFINSIHAQETALVYETGQGKCGDSYD